MKDYQVVSRNGDSIAFRFNTDAQLLGTILEKDGVDLFFTSNYLAVRPTDTVTFKNVTLLLDNKSIVFSFDDKSIALVPVYAKYDALGRRRVSNGHSYIPKARRKSRAKLKEHYCEEC